MSTEQTPESNSAENADQESFRRKIAASDAKYEIVESSIEDTLPNYYIRRTDGSIESWTLMGNGPNKGKFMSVSDGAPIYKYLDLKTVIEQQSDLQMEYMIQRAKAVTNLGVEATDAVPVVGPNNPLITEVPSFSLPTAVSVEKSLAQPVESAEVVRKSRYDYLKTALPPIVRPANKESSKEDYDRMLFGSDEEQPWYGSQRGFGQYRPETEEDKQRNYFDKFVTEENRQDALGTLSEAIKATPAIRDALNEHGFSATDIAAVDAIRENAEVRFAVAEIIAAKLDRILADENDLGWRIKENSPNNLKTDPITGRRMTSRTYAVGMALKMIGGEFSTRAEGSDDILRNKKGDVEQGQHRHAATSALMSYY